MFAQSEKFDESYGGKIGNLTIFGQEADRTSWRLAAMSLASRGIDFKLGREPTDTVTRLQHPNLPAGTPA